MKKYPKKISPCPIKDAIFEIRFDSKVPDDAVLGIFISKLNIPKIKVENLPIMQIPVQVRLGDKKFKYQPHYKIITEDDYTIQIGPNVINIYVPIPYPGWDNNFYPKIKETIKNIEEINIINKIERIGLRYIDFFEGDIYNNITLGIQQNGKNFISKSLTFRSEIENKNYLIILQIANNIILEKEKENGSIIDIDLIYTKDINFDNIDSIINKAHIISKERFFDLFKNEYLSKFNPEY